VLNKAETARLMSELADAGIWFAFEPLPEDYFAFYVKPDAIRVLDKLIDDGLSIIDPEDVLAITCSCGRNNTTWACPGCGQDICQDCQDIHICNP
jgi:hypothetical protein